MSPQEAAQIRQKAGLADPMLDLTPREMADLQHKSPEKFNLMAAFQVRPDVQKNPEAVSKVAQAWSILNNTPMNAEDVQRTIAKAPEAVGGFLKSVAENLANLQSFTTGPGIATTIAAAGPKEAKAILTRSFLEQVAAAHNAWNALADTGLGILTKLGKGGPPPGGTVPLPGLTGTAPPVPEPGKPTGTPDEQIGKFYFDLATNQHTQDIASGHANIVSSEPFKQLTDQVAAAGYPVRPDVVASLTAAEPTSFAAQYLLFKGAGAMSPELIPEAALARAGTGVAEGLGRTIQLASKVGIPTAKVVAKIAPSGGYILSIPKLFTGDILGFIGGATIGQRAAATIGKKILPQLQRFSDIGEQIAGKTPVVGGYTQLAKDLAEVTPKAAYDLSKGILFDTLPVMSAQTPDETPGIGVGTLFGLFGAGMAGTHAAVSGQLIGPRMVPKVGPRISSNGNFPGKLETMHNAALTGASPQEQVWINGVRELVNPSNPNSDIFYLPLTDVPPGGEDPRVTELAKLGLNKARLTQDLTGPDAVQAVKYTLPPATPESVPKQIVVVLKAAAAPHDASHLMETVFGEGVMRQVDKLVQSLPQYRNNWEGFGQDQARRLGWDPTSGVSWQDHILARSAWGPIEASDKMAREWLQAQEGPMTQTDLDNAWMLLVHNAPGESIGEKRFNAWKNALTLEERNEIANRYVSREIVGENFDALFKRGFGAPGQLPGKLATLVAAFMRAFGQEPLAGRVSEVGKYPLSADVIQGIRERQAALDLKKGVITPLGAPAPKPSVAIPTTPEQKEQAGTESTKIANTAPDTIPVGGIRSQKEILGTIAEAVAANEPTALEYRATPGVPAAGAEMKGANLERVDRDIRRSEIQLARLPDAVRSLWERLFTPTKVLKTKGGKFLVQGYNPQVFAANADTMASALADLIAKRPDFANLSPFPIDPATKSFTPEGWKQLHDYLYQNVIPNYLAGRTASGVPIKMPEEVIQQGFYKPGLAPGRPMDQRTSEFISMLFGVPLPKSLRSVAEKMPLNIMGQRVRVATLGTEAVEPLVPRKPATEAQKALWGPEAAVLETNPTRSEIEHALQENGIPIPSLMETIQHLRAENIVDAERLPGEPRLEGSTVGAAAGFQPREAQFQVNKPAEDISDFRPEAIEGATVHLPHTSYPEAAAGKDNPWVRRSADPSRSTETDNSNRTLLVQISNDLINPESLAGAAKDEATRYYDMLYSGARPGYARLQDFWEIPQWIGYASHFLSDADVYVVRNIDQAKQFLETANYRNVAFSALDTNKGIIREVVQDYPGKVDIGGYVDPKTFEDLPNVKWHDSMESLAKDMGVPYAEGVDYRHFQGSDVIPRLTMSKGCRHKCAFCIVPKTVEETSADVVRQQADAIANLGSKLVYLNDKTFGQASNYKQLAEINQQILAKNPDFKGFIIQTTAAQLKVMPADWLKTSGIKFVELGVESYNDPILKAMHKPASTKLINEVTDKLRQNGIALIPNIIIGYPNETPETYANTIRFLKDNKDIISHANIYNLALYKDAELGKQVLSISDNDFNENVLEKSFHTNPEIHRQFAGDVYGIAQSMLEGKPSAAQFAPRKRELPPLGISMLRMPDGRLVESDPGQLHYHAIQKARNLGYSEEDIAAADYGRKNLKTGNFVSTADLKAQWEGDLPSQMQSPANVGRIEDLPDTREKLFPAGPVYYSQLARTIEQKFSGEQMPASQLSAILKSPQSGIKAEELKWSGLEDYLEGKGRVTKTEIQDFLKANQVQVHEVTKGGEAEPRPSWQDVSGNEERWELSDPESGDRYAVIDYEPEKNKDYPWALYHSDSGRRVGLYEALEPAQDAGLDYVPKNPVSRGGTKFESYQLPGGENYREILFTLPDRATIKTSEGYHRVQFNNPKTGERRVEHATQPQIDAAKKKGWQVVYLGRVESRDDTKNFVSSHWDEPNVLAHTRINDRTDSAGKPGLFIEEIQSDWHQKGRGKGYTRDTSDLEKQIRELAAEQDQLRPQLYMTPEVTVARPKFLKNQERLAELNNQLAEARKAVPDAPFKNTWHELVFRRMVRQAADEGKDWVGWTTGEQQAERYDLSKQIRELTASPSKTPGVWDIEAWAHTAETALSGSYPAEKLPEVVGKDLADKIVATPEAKIFRGLDLKVGGEGMKGFYDKILVDYANKFGKKFGARVEDRKVPQTSHGQTYELREAGAGRFTIFEKTSSGDVEYDTFRSRDVAEQELRRLESRTPTSVHSLPITPEMRESVTREGVAQFQAATPVGKELERRGYKVFRDDYGPATGLVSLNIATASGHPVGNIEITQTSPTEARVNMVKIDDHYQGRGFGEVLYREAATELQKRGVELLGGTIVHPAPSKIRDKLFGAPVSREEAGATAWGGVAWDTLHRISPEAQFAPPKRDYKGEQILGAAVRFANGEVYHAPANLGMGEGELHGDAFNEAMDANPDLAQMNYEDGYSTNKRDFVPRRDGYKIALAANQITEKQYERAEQDAWNKGALPSSLRGEPQLESMAFSTVQREREARRAARAKGIPLASAAQPKTYVVRHGSTSMNNEDPTKDKIRGFANPALSEAGKKEVIEAAKQLAGADISTVITSDLKRARQTADAIATETGAKVMEDPNLRPWHFGPSIEGKPTSEMLPVINKLVENPDKHPPGGESFNEFKDRFIAAFHKAQDDYPDENTAIVTHYRGTKLLDAWRATGTDNDTIDRAVFENYDKNKEPGSFDIIDKAGAELPAQYAAQRKSLDELFRESEPDQQLLDSLSRSELRIPLPVKTIDSPGDLYTTTGSLMRSVVRDVRKDPERWAIVQGYKQDFEQGKSVPPIITSGDHIEDGNHRAMGAYLAKKPLQAVDLQELPAQFAAGQRKEQETKNNQLYLRGRNTTHGWWMNPAGNLIPLATGEHSTDALKILGTKVPKSERYDAYGQAAITAYETLKNRGWVAVLPQRYFRAGEAVNTLLFRGSEADLSNSQRDALERLAIEHDLVVNDKAGDSIYRPPTTPESGEEPTPLGGVQYQLFPSKTFDDELKKIPRRPVRRADLHSGRRNLEAHREV